MDTPRANLEKLQDCGVWARRPADVAGLCHVLSLLRPQPVVRIGGGQLLQADHLHNHGSCPTPLDLHLHEEDDHDNLQADPGLPERLQLVPLVGHHVGPPNRDGLLAPDLPGEGGSLPVQEEDVHRYLGTEGGRSRWGDTTVTITCDATSAAVWKSLREKAEIRYC